MPDLTTILRDAFLHHHVVRAVEIERRHDYVFITTSVAAGSDQRSLHGTLRDIRRLRPDLRVDLFVDEI